MFVQNTVAFPFLVLKKILKLCSILCICHITTTH